MTIRSGVNALMTAISYLFLAALILTVLAVVLVIVGPIILNRDILADPLYTQIEDFLRQMLLYIIYAAIGYIVFSWGRKLSEPKEGNSGPETPTPPSPATKNSPVSPEPPSSAPSHGGSSHSYRPEAVPPTHP